MLCIFLISDLYLSDLLVKNIARGYGFSNNIIALNYVKNTGAAFSILHDSREFLIIISVVALVVLAGYIIKHIKSISMKAIFLHRFSVQGLQETSTNV